MGKGDCGYIRGFSRLQRRLGSHVAEHCCVILRDDVDNITNSIPQAECTRTNPFRVCLNDIKSPYKSMYCVDTHRFKKRKKGLYYGYHPCTK